MSASKRSVHFPVITWENNDSLHLVQGISPMPLISRQINARTNKLIKIINSHLKSMLIPFLLYISWITFNDAFCYFSTSSQSIICSISSSSLSSSVSEVILPAKEFPDSRVLAFLPVTRGCQSGSSNPL